MENFLSEPSSLIGLAGSIAMILLGHVTNKYVLPFLKIGKRQQYAQHIAVIADEVTDDLMNRYSDKDWLKHLDEAVDVVISVCEIAPPVARRAVNAAVKRK